LHEFVQENVTKPAPGPIVTSNAQVPGGNPCIPGKQNGIGGPPMPARK
jgi:hypothetical protein